MNIEIQNILCPVDFSESGDLAFEYACAVARNHDASIEILHVAEESAYAEDAPPEGSESYEDRLKHQLTNKAEASGLPVTVRLLRGSPANDIIKYATERKADLIVIGTHGRTGVKHLLLGSVAEHVIRTAPCPVLTVRHPEFIKTEQ